MDYSQSLIDAMRAKYRSSEVSYFKEDARTMLTVTNESFDIILDKGTLDAILSDTQDGFKSAQAYMNSSWRILARNRKKNIGKFIVISTMPPDAISALFLGDESSRCIWDLGKTNMVALKTSAGGDVF
jgi:hypothetical protein